MEKDYLKIAGNIHLSYFIEAADILGIDYEIIIPSLTAKFSYKGGRHWFINNTVTPLTNAPSSKLARTKHFANMILDKAGLPVPKQQKLTKEIEAIAFYGKYRDIVLKPSQNIGGKGVSILPRSEQEVLESFKFAQDNDKHGKVLGEEYIAGDNYRVLVVGKKVVSVIKRVPAHIIADGVNTVEQLITIENTLRKEKLLLPIQIDTELEHKLESQNLSLSSKPEKDQEVILRSNANMTTGGTTVEVSDTVHPYYKEICINAIIALDLEYGGVDLITPDISNPTKCAINEVNFNPGLRIHYKVEKGVPQKVAVDIMRYIMEKYSK